MAESEEQVHQVEEIDEDDAISKAAENYKAPAQKSIEELKALDKDDESLQKYKAQLLKEGNKIPYPDNPNNVILKKLSVVVEGRQDLELDLEGDLKNLKLVVKEGAKYQLMISFIVQREIVAGLRLVNKVSRKGISVGKENHMVGSYGPQEEMHQFKTPADQFPSGMMYRGEYQVKSLFTDDDKKEYLAWEWHFKVKKDWED